MPARVPASSDTPEAEAEKISSDHCNGQPSNQGCEVGMDEDIVEEEEEEQPDAPVSFYINRDKYKMGCKIVTRCLLSKVVNVLEKTLQAPENGSFCTCETLLSHRHHQR